MTSYLLNGLRRTPVRHFLTRGQDLTGKTETGDWSPCTSPLLLSCVCKSNSPTFCLLSSFYELSLPLLVSLRVNTLHSTYNILVDNYLGWSLGGVRVDTFAFVLVFENQESEKHET